MSKTNLTLLLIACFKLAFTQVEKDKIPYSNADQLKGTFQIEVSSEKTPAISVTSALLESIEKNRHPEEIVYLQLTENCRIKIFPGRQLEELKKNSLPLYVIVPEFRNEN